MSCICQCQECCETFHFDQDIGVQKCPKCHTGYLVAAVPRLSHARAPAGSEKSKVGLFPHSELKLISERTFEVLGILAVWVYLAMGSFQLAASVSGMADWWGRAWWITIFAALPIAYIPVLGTVVGIMGAIECFGWSPRSSVLLFCWPYVLYSLVILGRERFDFSVNR